MKVVAQIVACFFLAVSCGPLQAAVTIQTADGRLIVGEVDEETDAESLWIRQKKDQILLTTAVAWSSVVAASQDGKALPVAELPELLSQQITSEPVGFLVHQTVYHAPVSCCSENCKGECTLKAPARQLKNRQVRTLQVDAFLVNLDRDVEPDGLELVVLALDAQGVPVPVKGSLYAKLWGERNHLAGSLVRFEELGSWTQPVKPEDFYDGVARFALRFRTVQPELDLRIGPDALVSVRLGVFGQGNFAASVPVKIRAFNPLRDRSQLFRGERFLPGELRGGRQQFSPARLDLHHRNRSR